MILHVNEKHENKYLHVLLFPECQGGYFSWVKLNKQNELYEGLPGIREAFFIPILKLQL